MSRLFRNALATRCRRRPSAGDEICPRNCSRAEPPESKIPQKYLAGLARVLYGEVPEALIKKLSWRIALRAQFERLPSAFEQVDDLFAAFIDGAALLNDSNPAIRVHDQHKLRFRQNGNIRVVGDEDHLAAFLQSLHRIHHCFKNEVIVQVVLRLIDNQRVVSSRQKYGQQRCALLAAGKIGRVLEVRPS